MGSASSSTTQAPDEFQQPSLEASDEAKQAASAENTKRSKNPRNLTGPKLVEYRCRRKKKAWSECVSGIYNTKFLTGESMAPEGDCDDLFERFRECYMKGMLKERQKKGLPTPKEGTALHEYLEEQEE